MALIAEYEIGCRALPFVDVAAGVPEATLEIAMVATAADRTPFVVRIPDGPVGAVEKAFDSADFVGEYTRVARTEGTARYQVIPAVGMEAWLGDHVDDISKLRALAANESIIDRISVTPTGWIQTAQFADRAAFDDFREFWQRNGEFTLRRLRSDRVADETVDGLTEPQREALLTANEMGYFEIPRTASLDDVATHLGISASSLSERLRRAQTHLVETTVSSRRAPVPR